jgi:hypothetical protein
VRPLAALALLLGSAAALAQPAADGARALIEDALRKHAAPAYLYEEQTLVMSDAAGRYSVRTARYYVRREAGGEKRLLQLETPAEVRGAALLVVRDASGAVRRGVYLPGARREPQADGVVEASGLVFGTDFSIADLEDEQPQDFRYALEADQDLERVPHHVVRALPKDAAVARATGYAERRLYLRKDNLFLSRIEYQDRYARPVRRQSFRDPTPGDTGAWRAGMVLMENLLEGHRTLLKVERRVSSPDYVPPEIFTAER